MKNISVIGLGYIGLPTSVLFADAGLQVHGMDVREGVVTLINQGIPHFSEPDLDILLKKVCDLGQFQAAMSITPSDCYIICVPTPLTKDKKPDLSFVDAALGAIIPHLKPDDLIILESTVPPQTCYKMAQTIARKRKDLRPAKIYDEDVNIHIAHCPERVLPGKILYEIVHNDRIIGGLSQKCTQKALDLYKMAIKGKCFPTNAATAELIKLSENAYRDINIAYANELSMICDAHDIDVWDVIHLANKHPRVNILSPGAGVGGHCIAVDPWFIADSMPHAEIIRQARTVNDSKPDFVIQKVKEQAKKLVNPKILVLGLTYKADVGDIRESPALQIAENLADIFGDNFMASDPLLEPVQKELLSKKMTLIDFEVGIKRADIIIFLTGHKVFKMISRQIFMQKIIMDVCGIFQKI